MATYTVLDILRKYFPNCVCNFREKREISLKKFDILFVALTCSEVESTFAGPS